MTCKEQVKILNDKIKANERQNRLDRINVEILAYSSGDLPKYEYLTKKDLGYKPDAFEQARFKYSPLGKLFTDGLDKSDKNEGLLKRLKNVENRNDNQLLAIKNVLRPAIKGKNNGGFRSDDDDDDDVNDKYKEIQDFKQQLIDKNILHLDGVKKFDNIVNKWKQTKDKKIVYKNDDTKVNTKQFNINNIFKSIDYDGINIIEKSIKNGIKIYQKRPHTDKNKSIINNSNKIIKAIELFKSMIDNGEFKIPGEYYAKSNNNINLSWIDDIEGYEETAEEAGKHYVKGNNDNELKLIKDFISKINNSVINNKNKAGNEFRKLKQKVTNDRLRQDVIKDLERYLFGENVENIEPEKEYEESMAERVKTRRQNKETDRDTQRTFAMPYNTDEAEEFLKSMKEEGTNSYFFSSGEESSGSGLKVLTKKQMSSRLPTLLAQIQAGKNSKKIKNELRQILYSLYRSKALAKIVYNNLIKVI